MADHNYCALAIFLNFHLFSFRAISAFVDKFDKLLIARGNFTCGELERALQYLELYMVEKKNNMQEQLPLLAEIYALLDEPDSVAGIFFVELFL